MYQRAPKLDARTQGGIVTFLEEAWKKRYPTYEGTGLEAALFHMFGRFAERIIERLNQAPDKNFLAFLDLLGASPLPPQPASVPLTFTLAGKGLVDAVVPAGTPG